MKRAYLAFALLAVGCQSRATADGSDSSTSTSTSTDSTSTEESADESASMEGSEATSSTEESESTFSSEEESETSLPTESTTDETGEDEQTCRDVVACVAECAFMADDPATCLFVCGAMAPPEASQQALELTMCLITSCVQKGDCTFDLGGEACPVCLLVGLIKADPEGCEEEAMACE